MKNNADFQPLKGVSLLLLTLSLSIATFMQMLDSTITNVAIPTISGFLGASADEGTWVITSFGVANAISIPLTGRLAQRLGECKLFITSASCFSLASVCCGLSTNLEMLIFFRVIQGLVAGPLIPLSQSLLLQNYPPLKRTMALSLWSMMVITAPIFGPIVGGYICDNYNWGVIFLINAPLCLITVLISSRLLRGRETKTSQVKINLFTLSFLVLGVGSLQIVLDKGKDLDWFSSSFIVTLSFFAVIGIALLIFFEKNAKNPLLDLSLFRSHNFTIGVISIVCAYLIYSGAIVLMPQLLQTVFGYTSLTAGLAYSPIGIMPLVIAPFIGRYSEKLDMRALVTFSFIIYAFCYYWRSFTFNTDITFFYLTAQQFIQGIAVGCFLLPLTTIALSGLQSEKLAVATSLINFFRTLSGSIGTSITITLWNRRASFHHSRLSETISAYNQQSVELMHKLRSYGLDYHQSILYINETITAQGLLMSANDIFYMSASVFMFLTVIVWFAKPPFNAASLK